MGADRSPPPVAKIHYLFKNLIPEKVGPTWKPMQSADNLTRAYHLRS
jgi:hypothetical protein